MNDMIREFEKVVLSTIFFMPSMFDKIKAKLTSSDFLLPLNAHIFSSFNTLSEKNKPFTPEFVCAEINKTIRIDLNYIIDIMAVSPIVDLESYIKAIKEASLKRKIKKCLESYLKESKDEFKTNPNELLIRIQKDVENLQVNSKTNSSKTATQILQSLKEKNAKIEQYDTGIDFLNYYFLKGGIELGQLVLISGDYEAGKTSLTNQMIEHFSRKHKVCLFNLEFPTQKMLYELEFKLQNKIKNNEITNEIATNILNNLIINDEITDINKIEEEIIENVLNGVKLFVIDSQMCLDVPDLKGEEAESKKFQVLQRLCQKYNIVIFLIVQTSKADNDSPYGSKKGGHFASIILRIEHSYIKDKSIKNKEYESNDADLKDKADPNKRIIHIQKNKQTGISQKHIIVGFNTENRTFYNLKPIPTLPPMPETIATFTLDSIMDEVGKNEANLDKGVRNDLTFGMI